jgi:fucose 4-O-acetylase-like acetyltransferase
MKPAFAGSRVSMEFDIFRYVLIFLMILGHNLGTKGWSCFAVDRSFQR